MDARAAPFSSVQKKVKHQKNKRFLNGVFLERQSMPITASYKQVMNFIQRGPFFQRLLTKWHARQAPSAIGKNYAHTQTCVCVTVQIGR